MLKVQSGQGPCLILQIFWYELYQLSETLGQPDLPTPLGLLGQPGLPAPLGFLGQPNLPTPLGFLGQPGVPTPLGFLGQPSSQLI